VASKVIGPNFGVAKRAKLVVVKIEPTRDGDRVSGTIRGLSMIGKDIRDKNLKGRAVVNLSGVALPPWGRTGKWVLRGPEVLSSFSNKITQQSSGCFSRGLP
jgi:hypothetical protein